jgi:hypothetical protein
MLGMHAQDPISYHAPCPTHLQLTVSQFHVSLLQSLLLYVNNCLGFHNAGRATLDLILVAEVRINLRFLIQNTITIMEKQKKKLRGL